MSSSNTTTDHNVIKKWVEKRGGKPAIVESTENKKGSGLLRIAFSQQSSGRLKEIDWDTFFQTFDNNHLSFLYQDKTKDGKESRFFKFIQGEA